jgi:hypothetical protein
MARRCEYVNLTAALPRPLVLYIFKRLPADQRARAACVCRAWWEAVADPALWLRLDLSAASGVRCRIDKAALRAAAARAHGRLEALDTTECNKLLWNALKHVVNANAASLRELRTVRVVDDVLIIVQSPQRRRRRRRRMSSPISSCTTVSLSSKRC